LRPRPRASRTRSSSPCCRSATRTMPRADAASRWTLAEDDVHVWRVALDRPDSSLRRLERVLSPEERARADRFVLDRVRRRFVACRGALRMILGRYTGQAPDRLQFTYGDYGKPALALASGGADLRFNVSHSDELALVA